LLGIDGSWAVTPVLRAEAHADLAEAGKVASVTADAHDGSAGDALSSTALPAQSRYGWLAAIARAGYAARAAHAAISAAAGTRHNQTISATSALSDADKPDAATRTGAADLLALAIDVWLRVPVITGQTVEA
jgi:hypothetical protein